MALPVGGGLVGGGTVFLVCPPRRLPSPELVRHFPGLPPGMHGFAGGGLPLPLPSPAGLAGQTYIQPIKANIHKKARTPTKPMLVGVLAFNYF